MACKVHDLARIMEQPLDLNFFKTVSRKGSPFLLFCYVVSRRGHEIVEQRVQEMLEARLKNFGLDHSVPDQW